MTNPHRVEIRELPLFATGWYFAALTGFWVILQSLLGWSLHSFAGAKEPSTFILLVAPPMAWVSGATTALVYNVFAKIFGGLTVSVVTVRAEQVVASDGGKLPSLHSTTTPSAPADGL